MKFKSALFFLIINGLLMVSAFCADTTLKNRQIKPDNVTSVAPSTYYIEISISRNLLTLYERKGNGDLTSVTEYTVGTAVRGLTTYPLGPGRVTGIYFNPWWYPTPYSRQVFRERGIELPAAVPPGHQLNYMGPFKIALSHRTKKGDI